MRLMFFCVFTLMPLAFAIGPIMIYMQMQEATGEALRCDRLNVTDMERCLDSAFKRQEARAEALLRMTGQHPNNKQ